MRFKKTGKYEWKMTIEKKYTDDIATVTMIKSLDWKVKASLTSNNYFLYGGEIIKETNWVNFKSKKSAEKYAKEFLAYYF